jgi:hypothetical protein
MRQFFPAFELVERVKAGLRNAKAKGKQLGPTKEIRDMKRIATLRAKGVGWKRIASELGVELALCIASPWRVPKSGKGFFEPKVAAQQTLRTPHLAARCLVNGGCLVVWLRYE